MASLVLIAVAMVAAHTRRDWIPGTLSVALDWLIRNRSALYSVLPPGLVWWLAGRASSWLKAKLLGFEIRLDVLLVGTADSGKSILRKRFKRGDVQPFEWA
jgi:hypothetical protein